MYKSDSAKKKKKSMYKSGFSKIKVMYKRKRNNSHFLFLIGGIVNTFFFFLIGRNS